MNGRSNLNSGYFNLVSAFSLLNTTGGIYKPQCQAENDITYPKKSPKIMKLSNKGIASALSIDHWSRTSRVVSMHVREGSR
mmetsp:Transcript_19273/g.33847  ORF Transcript_19273/g.33847 Transcript_19273/m.33847 type:complete len:81 (+) Transcript_19273:45-287(+)